EAELDARMPSAAIRRASRQQGGAALRSALALSSSPVLFGLARATAPQGHNPHHAVVLGAVTASAGGTPFEAAEAAAYASVSGFALAAQWTVRIHPANVAEVAQQMAPDLAALAERAAEACMR